MKTVSHLGPPEFQGIGLRDIQRCVSHAKPEAGLVRENETNRSDLPACEPKSQDGWEGKENGAVRAILPLPDRGDRVCDG